MRWIVLLLSLGVTIVSLIHGVVAVWQLASFVGPVMIWGSVFTWMTSVMLLLSVVIAFTGAVLAFNRRKIGGVFIIVAALICLLAHSSTRYYGVVYLVAGGLAFAVKGHSEYDYEFDEGDFEEDSGFGDDDEDEDDEEEEERGFPVRSRGGNRRERAAVIKMDREERSLNENGGARSGEPFRVRSSKVCPACGASTAAEHKFCYTCGGSLHVDEADVSRSAEAVSPMQRKFSSAFRDFKMVSPMDSPEHSDEDDVHKDETPENSTSRKVFIKPSRAEEEDFSSQFVIDPDDSYQEFSNYTRRRKRRRSSMVRRILAPLVLLLAIGGAAYLLMGIHTVPPEPPRLDPPVVVIDPPPPPRLSPLELLQIEPAGRGIVTGGNVNIRQSNAATGPVVTRLTAGARGDIIGQQSGATAQNPGTWFNINFTGGTGWIYGQFFQPLDNRQATLPGGYTEELLNSFGADRQDLIDILGAPTTQTPVAVTWAGLTAELSGDNIVRLVITGSQHELANGVAVGMSEAMLYSRVGFPSDFASEQLLYLETGEGTRRGMAIRLQDGAVQSITVGNI